MRAPGRHIANQLIEPHAQILSLRKQNYRTDDIVALVQEVISTDVDDTARFAQLFSPDLVGLQKIFHFVDHHFIYREDPRRNQWVQTPSFLWHTKRGDCKSFTVFISSILQNLGIPHLIRYVSYNFNPLLGLKNRPYTHVYPVALINGKEVPMDVVWYKQEGGAFGREKAYSHKKDFQVEGLYKLGTTTTDIYSYIGQVNTTLAELEAAMIDVPDEIVTAGPGDITQMTRGQLDRFIMEERYDIYADQENDPVKADKFRQAALVMRTGNMDAIGNTKADPFFNQVRTILSRTVQDRRPAFEPFKLAIPNPVPGGQVNGFFKGIGKFFKNVGKVFSNLFKKFVNWIFKGVGKKMGPYFIYLFANKSKVKSPEIRRRIEEQEKSFDWIRRIGKFKDGQLRAVVLNGIKKHTGKTPQEIFQEANTPQIGAIDFASIADVVLKAVKFVIQVVEKIIRLFKPQNKAGDVSDRNMSDPVLLEEEARLQKQGAGGAGGGGAGVLSLAFLSLPFLLKAA